METSNAFKSKVRFTEEQVEAMITDLKDLLGRLREKQVFDFSKEKGIKLLDNNNTLIEFKRTELTEVKRFISLVKASSFLLLYLARNPSSITKIEEIERSDRIMGSINIRKTMQNNRFANQKPKIVICNEIHKSIDTPENIILAQILFAILVYCNRYLSSKSILKSGAKLDVPTLESLAFIRNFVTNLLATKSIKAILPLAIDNMNNFDSFFKLMIDRIYLGKVPKNFVGIYTIFYQWKYYVWVSSREYELVKNTLRYYFYNLKNLNLLYESWVFYKILDLFTGIFDLRLAETSHSNGVATFRSHDGSISITYQRTYESGWIDSQGPIIYDKPDIVIEFNNLITLILDAKNSIITPTNPYPYRRQMDDYIASAGLDRTGLCNTDFFDRCRRELERNFKKRTK